MPKSYVRRYKRSTRGTRRFRRKYGALKRRYTKKILGRRIPRFKSPFFPRELAVKLRYTNQYHMTAAGAVSRVYAGNSIYDPDWSSGLATDGQPVGRDAYAAVYNSYIVTGSKCVVTFNNSAVDTDPVTVWLLPSMYTTYTGALNTDDAQGNTNVKNAPIVRYAELGPLNSQKTRATLKLYQKSRDVIGRDYQSHLSSSAMGFNPSQAWYWLIGAETPVPATSLNMWFTVTITYYVVMYQRNPTPVTD